MAQEKPPIQFQPPPANETPAEKKKRQMIERQNMFKDLVERKYPELLNQVTKQGKTPSDNPEVQKRIQEQQKQHQNSGELQTRALNRLAAPDRMKTDIVPANKRTIDDDPTIRELNQQAETLVDHQGGYIVQMAHKARSPKSNVPWIRIIGCETRTTFNQPVKWAQYLHSQLVQRQAQKLSLFFVNRKQPFMVCMDERHQFDKGTIQRIKRILKWYETEFYDQRTKFNRHRKRGLSEDEHKNRTSFFAREQAWREGKRRFDEENKKKEPTTTDDKSPPPETNNQITTTSEHCEYLRNHTFPDDLKQPEFNYAVVSYFRDVLAFQRCFTDFRVSVEDAEFQPVLIIWGLFESIEDSNSTKGAKSFCELTKCNHMFLQKNLSIVDMYKWLPLDSENLQHIPIVYGNKYLGELMSYRQAESRAIEEYHILERERFGEEADFTTFDPKQALQNM